MQLIALSFLNHMTRFGWLNCHTCDSHTPHTQGRKDVTDESVREQEIFQSIQGDNWCGFPNKRGVCRWPAGHDADLGHSRSGAIPVIGSRVLSWSWLLCPGLRCYGTQFIQITGRMARRIPDPGQSTWSRKLPFHRNWKQSRPGKSCGQFHV